MNSNRKEIVRIGLPWAMGMFLIMTFIFPWLSGEDITWRKVLISFPLWMLGGWFFGYSMNRWLPKNK